LADVIEIRRYFPYNVDAAKKFCRGAVMSPKKRITKGNHEDSPRKDVLLPSGAEEPLRVDKKYRSEQGSHQILESIKKMNEADLIETISYERKRLNDLAQKALDDCGKLDVETVREQNRIVESLLNEALLRRVEGIEEQE